MNKNTLVNYLNEYRNSVESVWTEETASPNLRPTKGKPISAGQCSATSLVLFEDLQKEFGPLDLKIALGKVWAARQYTAVIPLHVWLQLYTNPYEPPLIVDIAADQAESINEKVICAASEVLISENGYAYLADNLFLSPSELKPQTRERAAILRGLLERQ